MVLRTLPFSINKLWAFNPFYFLVARSAFLLINNGEHQFLVSMVAFSLLTFPSFELYFLDLFLLLLI